MKKFLPICFTLVEPVSLQITPIFFKQFLQNIADTHKIAQHSAMFWKADGTGLQILISIYKFKLRIDNTWTIEELAVHKSIYGHKLIKTFVEN